MPDHLAEGEDVESRIAVLASMVERQTQELKEVTVELRRTNDNLNAMSADARLDRERMGRLSGEVWAPDNSSRIRTLELHVKGLYALVGVLVTTVVARIAPAVIHFFVYGS